MSRLSSQASQFAEQLWQQHQVRVSPGELEGVAGLTQDAMQTAQDAAGLLPFGSTPLEFPRLLAEALAADK